LRLLVRRESQLVFSINWLIGTRRVCACKRPTRVPTQITCFDF